MPVKASARRALSSPQASEPPGAGGTGNSAGGGAAAEDVPIEYMYNSQTDVATRPDGSRLVQRKRFMVPTDQVCACP